MLEGVREAANWAIKCGDPNQGPSAAMIPIMAEAAGQ